MRGIIQVITGTFLIGAIALVAGVIVEPISVVVLESEAVQSLGWATHVRDIRTTVLRWTMLLGILFSVVWAAMWAIRRERNTGVRRR